MKTKSRFGVLVVLILTTWMSSIVLAGEKSGSHLSDFARTIERPAGSPTQSDICFSSRWSRPLNSTDEHDTFESARQFHATRIDWSYSNDADFIRKVKSAGLIYFGTISSEMDGINTSDGREKNYKGELIGNPELDFLMARGDVNSIEYRRIVMDHLRILIDGGADGIQFDDPGMTYHNMVYLGGGYGDASLKKFRTFLEQHSTPEEREVWGMPNELDSFDYASYVSESDGAASDDVRALFELFHQESLDQFYKDIHTQTDDYAGRRVPFSCNNWSVQKQDEFPFKQHFDFWVGETSVQYGLPTARRIYEKTKSAEALSKVQVFSPPNDGLDVIPTRERYVDLTRKLSATSYACGSATLVPWDVWRRGPKTPRFFGTVQEFGDLYDLISANADNYDDHEEVFAVGAGVEPQRVRGLQVDPARIFSESDEILMAIRAVPKMKDAPVVIHLVDWSEDPESCSVSLRHRLFGQQQSKTMSIVFHAPGNSPVSVTEMNTDEEWTTFRIPRLTPYGIIVVSSGKS